MRIFNYFKSHENALVILLLGLWSLLNFITAANTELIADESYYWFISEELQWGYYDHPPLFALLLRCGTFLLGDTELAVRLFTTLTHFATLLLFWYTVRTPKSTYVTALRYFVICFSLPLLHIYGFVATPDAPLLFGVALTIWALKSYVNSRSTAQSTYLTSVLFLALGFAVMAYSKYHGALVVMAVVLSRPRLLIDWRFYVVGALTLAMYLPHLVWQWNHDFVSFSYHLSGRSVPFEWRYVSEYLLNFFGAYNPFLAIPFFALLIRSNPFTKAPMERYYRISALLILLFFLFSTSRGHVQAQWMLPLIFPIIFFSLRRGKRSEWFGKYLWWTCGGFGLLLLGVRIAVLCVPTPLVPNVGLRGVAVPVERAAFAIAPPEQTQDKGVDALILDGRYHHASLFNYYSPLPTYAMPSVYSRSSHYEFIDMTTPLYGKRVAQEISALTRVETPETELFKQYKSFSAPTVGTIFYEVVERYVPTKNVKIELQNFPEKILTGQELPLSLIFTNPYDFDIPIGEEGGLQLVFNIRNKNGEVWDVPIAITAQVLGRKNSATINAYLTIPNLETDDYVVGFCLMQPPFASWYNSRVYELLIVNPKTRV